MDSSLEFKRVMNLVAALALFTTFVIPLPAHASLAEAQALLKWKSSLSNHSVTSLSSWIPSPHNATGFNLMMSECAWYGVFCNVAGSVVGINLTCTYVEGTLEEFPFSLLSLTFVDLSMNNLSGHIPFSTRCSLRTLDLSKNQLEGTLPQFLVNCKNLEVLKLGNNKIKDRFPTWLGTLPELKVLSLRSNNLQGHLDFPREAHPPKKLHILDLSNNNFDGPLPANLIAKLQWMMSRKNDKEPQDKSLYMNSLYSVEVILKGQIVQLVRILTHFAAIDLSLNSFQGNIPNVIGHLYSLIGLNLSHNHLMGSIPPTLGKLTNLECLDLSSNRLNGGVPRELGDLSFLGYLNLSENQLTGRIPQDKQLSTFTSNSFRGNLGLCGTPLQNACLDDAQPPPPPRLFFQEDNTREHDSGFDRKVVGMGYASGIVIGISIAYISCEIGRPKWLAREVRRMERRAKSVKKPKRKAIKFHGVR